MRATRKRAEVSSFKDQSFSARFGAMGDEAEQIFESVWPNNWVRFGLNRPPLHMASLPERIRHMPDYLSSANLIECKGVGRDDTIKLKVLDWNCANFWNQVHPLLMFIWSSHRSAWAVANVSELQRMIDTTATLDRFHDGRAYFALSGTLFCWTAYDRETVDA